MTVTLTPVVRDDLRALFRVKVAADQQAFVAPTEITLAQAAYEAKPHCFTIRADDEIVGLAAMLDFRGDPNLQDCDDPEAAYLWRLLIGTEHQNKGYGRAVMAWLIDWARAQGNPRMGTSAEQTNTVALKFYESLGFTPTGQMDGGEIVLTRPL